jgi:hypothetical protein
LTAPRQSDRGFGLTFAGFFAVVFAAGWALFDARPYWALALALLFAALALAYPLVLMPLNRLWGLLGARLGHVNNRVLLGVVFYMVITPMGVALRLFGKDLIGRRIDRGAETYLTPLTRGSDSASFRDQF